MIGSRDANTLKRKKKEPSIIVQSETEETTPPWFIGEIN